MMRGAIEESPNPQPLYDLPTFLETSYPQAGVRPRNPGYDWRTWARDRAVPGAQTHLTATENDRQRQREELLALIMQTDAHMQLPASRQTLLRIAKLELAQLWHYQLHQRQLPRAGGLGESAGEVGTGPHAAQEPLEAAATSHDSADAGRPAAGSAQEVGEGGDTGENARVGAEAPSSLAAVGADGGARAGANDADEDDIFAVADRKAREWSQQREQQRQQEQQWQQQQGKQQLQQQLARSAASRDPMSSLPLDVQLRLREVQRRAEAYGQARSGSLNAAVREVAMAFGQRISFTEAGTGAQRSGDAGGSLDSAAVARMALGAGSTSYGLRRSQMANPADLQLMQPGPAASSSSPPYWAEQPLLSYTDNIVALAARRVAARRLESAAGPDDRAILAAAVASLSASLPRPHAAPRQPATPVLDLLTDYLRLKYLDVLYAWEVAARLRKTAERIDRQAVQQRATTWVQAGDPLPSALRLELSGSWAQAATAFCSKVAAPLLALNEPAVAATSTDVKVGAQHKAARRTLAAPLEWSLADALVRDEMARITGFAVAVAPAANSAAAAGDLRGAAELALTPVLEAAAARHRALLASQGERGGESGGRVLAAQTAGVGAGRSMAAAPSALPGAASVVCFREMMTLDASSAFEDSSHDFRVSLEFDVDRLAASEPALGGAWGARFLQRLLALPEIPKRRRPAAGGSMVGRARRGAAARAAILALVYPVDVERRFCPRTRTASLTTGRYTSRDANRKLLLEHYAALLRATALAASSGRKGSMLPMAASR